MPGRHSQVITTSKGFDLSNLKKKITQARQRQSWAGLLKTKERTHVSERSTHDNCLVIVLLVVVENSLHRYDTWVFIALEAFPSVFLVPIKDLQKKLMRNKCAKGK